MNIKRLTIAILVLAFCACAQTNYTFELGAGGYASSTPHSAGSFNVIVGGDTNKLASYSTFQERPLSIKSPSIVGLSGVQWTVASSGKLEFAALLDAGVANGGTAVTKTGTVTGTSFAGATGGKISYWPGWQKAKGLYFWASGQEFGTSSTLGGFDPLVQVGIGFQLSGSGGGTLSARRKK